MRRRPRSRIEDDPVYQQAYAEALGEERFAALWLPSLGRWDVRVDTFFLWIGLTIAAIAMALLLVLSHARPSDGAILAVPGLVALTGWALARWFGGANVPTEHLAGPIKSIIAWVAILWCARRIVLAVVPDASAMGIDERLFLAPAIIAFAVVIGARLHLRWWVTAVSGLVAALGFSGSLGTVAADRTIAVSGALQLSRAQATGETLVMRGDLFFDDLSRPGALQPLTRVVAAKTCATGYVEDRRRTALGLVGRTLAARAEVCWDERGHPVSAWLDGRYGLGHAAGEMRGVRVAAATPEMARGPVLANGFVPLARARYDDARGAPLASRLVEDAAGRAVFDRYGRPLSGNTGPSGSAAASRTDQTSPVDTTTVQVASGGAEVTLTYAVEARDPLVRDAGGSSSSGESSSDGSLGEDSVDDPGPDRTFPVRNRDGVALDVLVFQFAYRGSGDTASADGSAAFLRSTSHGLSTRTQSLR